MLLLIFLFLILGVYIFGNLIGNIILLKELQKRKENSLRKRKYGIIKRKQNPYR